MKAKWLTPALPWLWFTVNAAIATRNGFTTDLATRVIYVIGVALVSITLLVISRPWRLTKREIAELNEMHTTLESTLERRW